MDDNYLAHFGVKGMKWGVRRKRSGDSSETRSLKRKPIKSMSNAELKRANERMNLEANYKDLVRTRNASPARKFARKVIMGAAVAAATPVATAAIKKGGSWLAKNGLNFTVGVASTVFNKRS